MKLRGAIKNFSKSIQFILSKHIIRGDSLRDLKSRHGFRYADKSQDRVFLLRTSFRDAILRNRVLLLAPGINEAVIIQFRSYSAFRLTTNDIVMQIALSCLWPTWLGLERMSIFRFTCNASANYATLPLSTLERSRRGHGMLHAMKFTIKFQFSKEEDT